MAFKESRQMLICYYDIVKSVRQEISKGFCCRKEVEHVPYRSNMPCKHPGCAKLIPYGQQYCEEHQSLHRNDRASACEWGYGAKWQRERKKFLDTHPFCVKCYDEGSLYASIAIM